MWFWGLLPLDFSNRLLKSYLFLRDLPERVLNQTVRTLSAVVHSFQNDSYWFYSVGDHYFAQHNNSSVMRVHKGKPQWLYTPHDTLFSWVAPITYADSDETMRRLVHDTVTYKRLPIIGATLYHRTATVSFEYDMSEWISGVRIMSPLSTPIDVVPLLVLVLAWGLTHEVCFEGDLSKMEIVLMSDMGDEKRFRVVTQEEIEPPEEGEIVEDWGGEGHQEELEDTLSSTESDASPAPEHRQLPTPASAEEDT
jgi:hypothetical protein